MTVRQNGPQVNPHLVQAKMLDTVHNRCSYIAGSDQSTAGCEKGMNIHAVIAEADPQNDMAMCLSYFDVWGSNQAY